MQISRQPLQIVRAHLRVYLFLNVAVYSLVIAGFVAALVFPELNVARADALEDNGTADLVKSLFDQPWLFALVIFGVNTLTVGVLSILLPSMVVPFAGIVVFGYRAFTIGSTLAPANDNLWVALIPHSLTVLIEFQAYILLTLGAYLLGMSWLRPTTVGASTRRRAYVLGLKQIGWLSLPALALFVIGAVYEALTLRYVVPLLMRG